MPGRSIGAHPLSEASRSLNSTPRECPNIIIPDQLSGFVGFYGPYDFDATNAASDRNDVASVIQVDCPRIRMRAPPLIEDLEQVLTGRSLNATMNIMLGGSVRSAT